MDKPYKGSGKKWEMPSKDDNYHRTLQDKPWRTSLKPLNIDQPEGPSFQVRFPPAMRTLTLTVTVVAKVRKNPCRLAEPYLALTLPSLRVARACSELAAPAFCHEPSKCSSRRVRATHRLLGL